MPRKKSEFIKLTPKLIEKRNHLRKEFLTDKNVFKKILKKGIKTEPFDKKAHIHNDES